MIILGLRTTTKINTNNTEKEEISIPARSSKVIELFTKVQGTFLCDKAEIIPGVFISNSISSTDSHNRRIKTMVINTQDVIQKVKISRLRRQFKKVDTDHSLVEAKPTNYINNIKNGISEISESDTEREKRIMETLNPQDLSVVEKTFLDDVVHRYSDIFFSREIYKCY